MYNLLPGKLSSGLCRTEEFLGHRVSSANARTVSDKQGWLVSLSLTSNCVFEKPGKYSLRGIMQSIMLVAMVWEVPENFKCSLVVAISGPEMMMRDSLMECRF